MLEQIKEILNNDVEQVIKSAQLSLSLCKCYSKLYLNGAAPRVCAAAQRKYYLQLKIDGMNKVKLIEKAKERTCKPNFNGLCYSSKACKHYSSELLNDEEAIIALEKGFLKEAHFEKLPEGYKKVQKNVNVASKKSNAKRKRK